MSTQENNVKWMFILAIASVALFAVLHLSLELLGAEPESFQPETSEYNLSDF